MTEAGRRYKRHAPAADRAALEERIVRHLCAAKAQAAAGTQDGGGSTVPGPGVAARRPGSRRVRSRQAPLTPNRQPGHVMRTLEYTLPDGSTGTASPDDVAKAVEALLMDGTMVMDSKELRARLDELQTDEARFAAIVRAVVGRAVERGIATR